MVIYCVLALQTAIHNSRKNLQPVRPNHPRYRTVKILQYYLFKKKYF